MRAVGREVDWKALRIEVLETFTPGPPINEVAEFAGRKAIIQRLQDIAIEKARHAIIFGERGVGKTSLANIFYKDLNSATRMVRDIAVDADSLDSFDSIWRKVFRRIRWPADNATLDNYYPGPIEPDHVFLELSKFGQNEAPIIIIDEYDRISDETCRVLMTDLIKALARAPNNPTLILVGVADNILQLVRDHGSIHRNLVQIPMDRMTSDEIKDVISTRVRHLRMKITDDALWRVAYFSAGLPFYAHSLGKYSALRAVEVEKLQIDEALVLSSLIDCIADVDYTIAESYTRATEKIYRKGNIFAQVLAACALTENNDLGQFTAAAVEGPLSEIMGEPYEVSAFSFHLNQMTNPERGSVLRKTGARRTFQYHFAEPAMQPFIIMKSLEDGVLRPDVFERFYVKRQKSFSI
ncbi:ATP-binding protein [Mesorhizobium sp. VK24D]|uniref:ATP-binding protein n=1 Tax=Mesorhizobium album TaxID=3072314 RepID=A0ABU4Y3V0_9HYPH|nr:ATP-binding protein [Mesorhizobium sp. VK24D]MDX8481621.1 ATP-binding protein [Mesorhizobium sp. VK24D]